MTDFILPENTPSCAESTDSFSEQEISDHCIPKLEVNKKTKTPTNQKQVCHWNVNNVVEWFNFMPFPEQIKKQYTQLIIENAVHGPLLLKLNHEMLKDMGISKLIHRERILTDINLLKKSKLNVSNNQTDNEEKKKNSIVLESFVPEFLLKVDQMSRTQNQIIGLINQLQGRVETMPYWNRVRMVEKLGLADTESISRHFEDLEYGALYYPSIYVKCEKSDHIIIGHYTCYGKLYGKPFYVKSCRTKKLLLYYRSDLEKKRWRFTRTNKHSLADFCEKRKYQARTKESADFEAAHLIPQDTCWAVWDGRTDHNWSVNIEISDHQPYLYQWIADTHYGCQQTMEICKLCASFIFVENFDVIMSIE